MALLEYFTQHITIEQYLDFFIRILVACLCGAAIGYERSRRLKSAGLRTHIIVCCASALMMIISKYGFIDMALTNGMMPDGLRADPARIAAQVVSGISFLGAGVIFKHGSSVKGLTTAAGIWATAGIGLAIGAGMYVVGMFSMVVIALLQFLMHKFKFGVESWTTGRMDFNIREDAAFRQSFLAQIDKWKAQVEEIEITEAEDGTFHYDVALRMPSTLNVETMVQYLTDDKRITRFSVTPEV